VLLFYPFDYGNRLGLAFHRGLYVLLPNILLSKTQIGTSAAVLVVDSTGETLHHVGASQEGMAVNVTAGLEALHAAARTACLAPDDYRLYPFLDEVVQVVLEF
jgi:hypothetical protein